jgi:hypothetical protein
MDSQNRRKVSSRAMREWMSLLVTTAVGAAALYIVLSNHYGQDSLKWAYGVVGTVMGYWLKR